jgi:hypothetical protein
MEPTPGWIRAVRAHARDHRLTILGFGLTIGATLLLLGASVLLEPFGAVLGGFAVMMLLDTAPG